MNTHPDGTLTPAGIRLLFDNRALRRADGERIARRGEWMVGALALGCLVWALYITWMAV